MHKNLNQLNTKLTVEYISAHENYKRYTLCVPPYQHTNNTTIVRGTDALALWNCCSLYLQQVVLELIS